MPDNNSQDFTVISEQNIAPESTTNSVDQNDQSNYVAGSRVFSPAPETDFKVLSEEDTQKVYDEKRQGTYEVPSSLTPRETEYVLGTEVDKNDKGRYFGLVDLGVDFVKNFSVSGFTAVASDENPASDSVNNFFKGVISGALGTEEQVGGLVKNAGEVGGSGLAIPGFIDGLKIAQQFKKDTPIIPRTAFDDMLVSAGQTMVDQHKEIVESLSLGPSDESPFSKLSFDLGSGSASVATAIGLLYLTKNPALVGGVFGALEKGSIFNEARAKGKGVLESDLISTAAGGIQGALQEIGGGVFLHAVVFDKVITRTLIRAASEGVQELLQQAGEESIAKITHLRDDKLKDVLYRVMYAGLLGTILGAPAGAVTAIAEKQGAVRILTDEVGLTPEQAKLAVQKISAKALENKEAQGAIMDLILDEIGGVAMTREERKQRAAEVKKEMDAQWKRVFEKAPSSEKTMKQGFENAILQGRLTMLEKESAQVLKEIDQLEREQKLRRAEGKPIVALEKSILDLVNRFHVIDSEMAQLLIEQNPEDVKRSPLQLSSEGLRALEERVIKQSDKIKERVAKIATVEERKRVMEASRIIVQIKKANIKSLPITERAQIETLQKQLTNVRTLEGLRNLNNLIQKIKTEGKEKFAAIKELKDQLFEARKQVLVNTLDISGEKVKTQATQRKDSPSEILKAVTLRGPRLLDMFDGGQDFQGPFYKIFYGLVNQAFNNEVAMTNKMQAKGLEILQKNKISGEDLSATMNVDGVTVTRSEAMHLYGALGNEETLAAVVHGNNIPLDTINKIVSMLPEKFRVAADEFLAEFGAHFDRLRLAYIDFTDGQRDLPKVKGVYTPMWRQGVDYKTSDAEIEADMTDRAAFRKVFVERGLTKARATDIKPENQSPIYLGLVETYFRHTTVREHFIAMAKVIKELQRLRSDKEISQGINEKFGPQARESFELFMNRVANPHVYEAFKFWPKLAKMMRQRAAIVHLGWNTAVMLKQPASLARFLGDVGPIDLFQGVQELLGNWDEKIKFIHERDPQLAHRSISQALEEVKNLDSSRFTGVKKLRDKFGESAFSGIVLLDQFTTHAGWLAVFNKAVRDGFSEAEAIEMAQTSVLRTQPAASAKDLSALYGTNAFADLFLQFTDQLNQDWNAITHDIPNRIKLGKWKSGMLGYAGLAAQISLIWILTHGRLPEDSEDMLDAVSGLISVIPLIGPMIDGLRNGYDVGLPAGAELFLKKPVEAGKALLNSDFGKFLDKSLYFGAAAFKIPYTAIRRAVMGLTDLANGDATDFRRLVYSKAALEKD